MFKFRFGFWIFPKSIDVKKTLFEIASTIGTLFLLMMLQMSNNHLYGHYARILMYWQKIIMRLWWKEMDFLPSMLR